MIPRMLYSIIVADFGISGELTNTLQKRNTLIGTPFFLAPEVIMSNEGTISIHDSSSNLYSLFHIYRGI